MPAAEISLRLTGDFLGSESRRAAFVLLVAFLLSFGFIRMSTRLMRSPRVSWWPGSIKTGGGLHIHHLVFGIVLMMVAGFAGFAFQPASPWLEILAAAFGIGVGLTLDEFALWLYLEDVYWAEEGRRSVDAAVIATTVAGTVVVGTAPLGQDATGSVVEIAVAMAWTLGFAATAALKGKIRAAIVGMFIPPVGWVAAIRLAKPGSPWARRRYAAESEKLARATARAESSRKRYRRWQERIGGRPTPVDSVDGA